jgi:uncharacterized membrane protein YidH (DUF202 family)
MVAKVSRPVRLRAALGYLSGLGGVLAFPILAGVTWLFLGTRQPSPWATDWVLLLGTLIMAFSGWPIAVGMQRYWHAKHPYLQRHGRQAVKLWRALALGLMLLFVATTVVVVPACAQVADQHTSPPGQFVFSWVVGWLFFETLWAIALMLPIVLFKAVRTYLRPE